MNERGSFRNLSIPSNPAVLLTWIADRRHGGCRDSERPRTHLVDPRMSDSFPEGEMRNPIWKRQSKARLVAANLTIQRSALRFGPLGSL